MNEHIAVDHMNLSLLLKNFQRPWPKMTQKKHMMRGEDMLFWEPTILPSHQFGATFRFKQHIWKGSNWCISKVVETFTYLWFQADMIWGGHRRQILWTVVLAPNQLSYFWVKWFGHQLQHQCLWSEHSSLDEVSTALLMKHTMISTKKSWMEVLLYEYKSQLFPCIHQYTRTYSEGGHWHN